MDSRETAPPPTAKAGKRCRERHAYSLDDLPQHLATAILEAEVPDELEEVRP